MENNENNSNDNINDSNKFVSEAPVPEATKSLLDKAEETATRLEEANKKREELLRQEEELYARKLIAGRGEIQPPPIPRPREEIVKDEVNILFKGLSPYNKKQH